MSNFDKPRPGFCTLAHISRIIDADTIEVEIKRKFSVRLVHQNENNDQFNCPELSTQKGRNARDYVQRLLKPIPPWNTPQITLFIPAGEDEKLMDVNSFNRILGEIWVDDEKLTDILLEEGYGELKKK